MVIVGSGVVRKADGKTNMSRTPIHEIRILRLLLLTSCYLNGPVLKCSQLLMTCRPVVSIRRNLSHFAFWRARFEISVDDTVAGGVGVDCMVGIDPVAVDDADRVGVVVERVVIDAAEPR